MSVVEIAELATLPERHSGNGRATGPVGAELLAIVGVPPWGSRSRTGSRSFAAPAVRGDRPTRRDARMGWASSVRGVAAISSLPVLIFSDVRGQETVGDVPAVIIGVVGYLVARAAGKSRVPSVFYDVTALALGVIVALLKSALAAH